MEEPVEAGERTASGKPEGPAAASRSEAAAGPAETLVCPHCNATSFHVTRRDDRSLHLACTSCDAPPLSLEPTLRIWEPQEAADDGGEGAEELVELKEHDDREPDPVVMAELRAWRIAEAGRRKIPRYRVLPNRTIETLAKRAPRDLDELEDVWGIGPTRLERYGSKILQILHGDQHGGGPQLAQA